MTPIVVYKCLIMLKNIYGNFKTPLSPWKRLIREARISIYFFQDKYACTVAVFGVGIASAMSSRLTASLNLCLIYLKLLVHVL